MRVRKARQGIVVLLAIPALLGVIGACRSSPVSHGPPALCKIPAPAPTGKWFTDVTNEVGFAGINGIRVSAADLDGDGWVDVVVHGAPSARDPLPMPTKHVLMNRHGHFTDAVAVSGLLDSRDGPGTGRLSHLMVFGDVDNDGDLDAFSGTSQDASYKPPASTDRSEILLNDGKGHFSFAEASAPSAAALPTSAASFVDIDRDGMLDLFVGTFYSGNEGAGNRLYRGSGDGTLSDVSASSNVLRAAAGPNTPAFLAGNYRRPAYGVTACDVDGDGNADLLVSSYGRGWNELWQNKGDGTFKEIGQGTPFAADDDLAYRDNEFYRCWCKSNPGSCPPAESQPGIDCTSSSWQPGLDDQPARLGGNTFSTACGDLDNDGDLDILHAEIRHWHIGESSDPTQILRNQIVNGVPTFTRLTQAASGIARPHVIPDWNEGDLDVAFFDFDADGKKDLYLSSTDYPETYGTLFHQKADGTFEDVGDRAGVRHYHAHGFVAVDIDNDGDLDLIVSTSTARCAADAKCPATQEVHVYRNDVGSSQNQLQLRLRGGGAGKANRAAIGARVSVTAGGITQVQEVGGGYGHYGMQHGTLLTFGLGAACAIDKVEVRWPDAASTIETFANISPNYVVEIQQGNPTPAYATP